jgi:ubiquinone/menaquinone biosynthesis C-methylase UbiE
MTGLNLPACGSLKKLGLPVLDRQTALIYHPLFGILYRKRFRMILDCLGGNKENILEIGFGRGLLLPELGSRCSRLYGLDVHSRIEVVKNMLSEEAAPNIFLNAGSVTDIPYKNKIFDTVVCISVFEHIVDLKTCFQECSRVLKDSGELVLGFPVKNRLTDLLFRLLKYDARQIHPSSHRDILSAAGERFVLKKSRVYPGLLPVDYSLYFAGKFTKRQ